MGRAFFFLRSLALISTLKQLAINLIPLALAVVIYYVVGLFRWSWIWSKWFYWFCVGPEPFLYWIGSNNGCAHDALPRTRYVLRWCMSRLLLEYVWRRIRMGWTKTQSMNDQLECPEDTWSICRKRDDFLACRNIPTKMSEIVSWILKLTMVKRLHSKERSVHGSMDERAIPVRPSGIALGGLMNSKRLPTFCLTGDLAERAKTRV